MNTSITTIQLLFQWFSQQNIAIKTLLASPPGLILLDILTGSGAALKQSTFDPKRLADFMHKDLLKYVVGVLAVLLVSLPWGNQVFLWGSTLCSMCPLLVTTVSSVVDNLFEMLPRPVQPVARALVEDMRAFEEEVALPVTPAPAVAPKSPTQPLVPQAVDVPEQDTTKTSAWVIPPSFTLPTQAPVPPSPGIPRPRE